MTSRLHTLTMMTPMTKTFDCLQVGTHVNFWDSLHYGFEAIRELYCSMDVVVPQVADGAFILASQNLNAIEYCDSAVFARTTVLERMIVLGMTANSFLSSWALQKKALLCKWNELHAMVYCLTTD